jgi:hypothetical protein
MRHLTLMTASVLLIMANATAGAGPVSPARLSGIDNLSAIELAQDKQKSEPLKEKVKRVWKNMVGYKFDVGCPAPIPFTHKTCTETGKNSADARAKCQAQNQFCQVTSMK